MKPRKESQDDSDGWVEEALQNDFMVANMLVQLSGMGGHRKQWARRAPRSRQQQQQEQQRLPKNDPPIVKNVQEPTPDSPATPLSWTSSSSPSDCKTVSTESQAGVSNTNMRRKIKIKKQETSDELKEQVNSLIVEKEILIKEIQTGGETLEELVRKNEELKKLDLVRKNEELKKLKLDMESHANPDHLSCSLVRSAIHPLIPDLNLPASEMDLDV